MKYLRSWDCNINTYSSNFKTIAEEGDVDNFKLVGNLKGYNDDYNITFTETYDNSKLLQGSSTDSAGNHHIYTKRLQTAEFPGGGLFALARYLGTHVRYPAVARENGIQGKVYISFTVGKAGESYNFKIVQPVDQSLDNEALTVLKTMPKWIPAKLYGAASTQNMTVPISFTLGAR